VYSIPMIIVNDREISARWGSSCAVGNFPVEAWHGALTALYGCAARVVRVGVCGEDVARGIVGQLRLP